MGGMRLKNGRDRKEKRGGGSTLKVLFSSCSAFPCTKDKRGELSMCERSPLHLWG